MSQITNTQRLAPFPSSTALVARAWARLADMKATMIRRNNAKKTAQMLDGLSDDALKDIGLDRGIVAHLGMTGTAPDRLRYK